MAKMGKFDPQALKDFQQKLEKINQDEVDAFLEDCTKELAARLLRMVIERTPVGKKPKFEGKKTVRVTGQSGKKKTFASAKYAQYQNAWNGYTGGTLRRGWTGGKQYSKDYVNSLEVRHEGNKYIIEIVNPVEYATYVEYGHRQTPGRYVPALGKSLKQGWVDGRFMMTISENELKTIAPKVLESKLKKFLGGVLQ